MKKLQLSNAEIRDLCASLSMLIHSGMHFADGLAVLAEDGKEEYKDLLLGMSAECDKGINLADVFKNAGAFPKYVCDLVSIGEDTGRMEEALDALTRYYDERFRLERQVKTTLLYPMLLLGVIAVVIVVLLVEVLPIFDQVYGQMGSSLTGIAGILLSIGEGIKLIMPFLCIVLAAVCIFAVILAVSNKLKSRLLYRWQQKHGSKGVYEKINMAHAAQAVSMGMSSGLNIEEAISFAAKITEDIPEFKRRCESCAADINKGVPLAQALSESKLIPKAECRLLEIAMRSGQGDDAMRRIADRLIDDSENALAQKVSRIEPCVIIVTAGLVGLILIAVMMPLVEIITALG